MHPNEDSVVITGMGVVSPFGTELGQFQEALEQGVSSRVWLDESNGFPVYGGSWGSLIRNYDPAVLLGKRGLQYMEPSAKYLLSAGIISLQHAGLSVLEPEPEHLGIVIASNLAGINMSAKVDRTTLFDSPRAVSPMDAPNTLANAPASYLAIRIKSMAANTTISSGQCAGLDAFGYAANLIRSGRAKRILIGGVEELNDRVMWVYRHAGVIGQGDMETGKPFEASSSGWLPGEGAAAVVIERRSDAEARGATILGELVSWSSSFTSRKDPESRKNALTRSIRNALHTGGLTPNDIGLVASGANGYKEQDQAEAAAITSLELPDLPVYSVKGAIGELYGASGVFQAVSGVLSLQTRKVLPTVGYSAQSESSMQPGGVTGTGGEWVRKDASAVLLTAQDLYGGTSAVIIRSAS